MYFPKTFQRQILSSFGIALLLSLTVIASSTYQTSFFSLSAESTCLGHYNKDGEYDADKNKLATVTLMQKDEYYTQIGDVFSNIQTQQTQAYRHNCLFEYPLCYPNFYPKILRKARLPNGRTPSYPHLARTNTIRR